MRHYLFYLILLFIVTIKPCEAQFTPCDSVDILKIEYAPFNDSLIAVTVINHSSNLFGYPGFILFDSNGDTVAKETVNYFGIGNNEQVHFLQIYPGMPLQENFTGTLELWTSFYNNYECTLNSQVNLCPDTTCVKLFLSLGNNGGALAIGNFTWDIKNLSGTTIFNGSMNFTPTKQMDVDSVCMPFGEYIVEFNSAQQPMGQVFASLYTDNLNYSGPGTQFIVNNTFIDLEFYEKCDGTNSIDLPLGYQNIQVFVRDNVLHIKNLNGKAIGEIVIYDSIGRLITHERSRYSKKEISLANYPSSGYYLLQVLDKEHNFSHKFHKN